MLTIALTIAAHLTTTTSVLAFGLTPDSTVGNVRGYADNPDLYISSGSKARAISTLSKWLPLDYSGFNAGSGALFKVQPGIYQITWQLYTARDEDSDWLGLWDGTGNQIQKIASSTLATIPKEYEKIEDFDRWRTDSITTTFTTTSGEFALFAFDGNRRWDTTWKLEGFEQIGELTCQGVPEPSTFLGISLGILGILKRKK